MNAAGYIHKLSSGAFVLLAMSCVLQPALANIYAYTGNDGTVNLSNVPADDNYTMLIPDPAERSVTADRLPSSIASKAQYDKVVEEIARTYGLDSALLHAVISVESQYRPHAVSPKGAAGLMQLMPLTARHYGVANPLDPVQNLHGGAKYLSYLLKQFDNDVSLALAAYNAGETAVAKYGNRIPPYRETTKYVPRVLGFYRKYQAKSL
ncbi:MAG TPA: lytic transglycosylase domain-containing protein [Gallionella sp.]|nr:lytic transglycosylase domain-containing protein [Gallionella sp.]